MLGREAGVAISCVVEADNLEPAPAVSFSALANPVRNIFLIKYLTQHTVDDILEACTRNRRRSRYSTVLAVVMNGFHVTLIKSRRYVQNAIARIGRNLVRASKRRWYEWS